MQQISGEITGGSLASAPEGSRFEDYFKFEGKRYRIFKRREAKDGNWYVHFARRGRRYLRSLDSPVKETAILNGKILIGAVRAENWRVVEETKLKRDCVSLGEIFGVYLGRMTEIEERTRRGNVGALRIIVRQGLGLGPEAAVDGERASLLTEQLVRRWKVAIDGEAEGDRLEAQRRRRTANSYLRQARSIFTGRALELYADAGLVLPELRGFLEAAGFRGVGKRVYDVPDDELIGATFAALDGLRTADRSAYIAICLAVGAGLRKGEIGRCQASWFVLRQGRPFIRGGVTKNGDILDVRLLDEWWERIRPLLPGPGIEDGFVLPGTKTERTDLVFDRVSAGMRGLGWRTQKKIHEFRAYVGSRIADEFGLEAARDFLRHDKTSTTEQYYGRYRKGKDVGGLRVA